MVVIGTMLRRGAAFVAAVACLSVAAPAEARRQGGAPPVSTSPYPAADSLEGNFLAAYIAGSARDTVAAAVFYREALREDPTNPELMERAFISLLADGDVAAAQRVAERLIVRNPNNALAQLTLAVKAFKAKQFATARTILGKGARGRAADVTSTLLTAWSFAGSREGARALEVAGALRGERAFAVFRDYHAGLIAELVGNVPEAEARLKAAYDTEKSTLRVVDAYARLQARLGRPEAALAGYRGYEALAPRHPSIRYALDQLNAGRTLPPLVQSAAEGAAELLYGLGSAGNQSGDELASIVYLRLALHLNPDHALALVTLADVFERLKRTPQAIEVLRRMPAGSPMKTSAEVQIGLSLEQLGQGAEAVQLLERVTAERPDDTEALVALGNVLRSRKSYPEAAEAYSRAIEKTGAGDGGLWPLYYYRGTTYERAKQWPKAEADLKRALELVPDSQPLGKSQVLNYLGYSWVDQNLNLDEAFRLLRRAVELNPRDGMIIDSLGWAHYRFGQYEEAVGELEKAAELKAGDPVINDHLGDAYWHVGRRLEAQFQWQHAKDSNPEPDDLKKIEDKLSNGLSDTPKPATSRAGEPEKNGG